MDELFKLALKYFPITIIIIAAAVYVFLLILKEIKIIFFDKAGEDETFTTKLKYLFFFWIKRKKRVKEPKHIKYSDEEREKAISDLLIHNFFQAINNTRIKLPSMNFGNDKKSELLRGIIKIYIDVTEKYVVSILKNYKLDELTTVKLNAILMDEIGKAGLEIKSKIIARTGELIYNMLIKDPVKGFNARNATFKEIFIDGILLLSSQSMSVYKYDNYRRASEILTSMYVSSRVILKNFEQVFKDFNGELEKELNK